MIKKQQVNVRIKTTAIDFLKRQAQDEELSQAELIEKCLSFYEAEINDERKKFMDLYRQLGEAIQSIEVTRDYGTEGTNGVGTKELDKDHETTLAFYNKIWDQFREQPFFKEDELED